MFGLLIFLQLMVFIWYHGVMFVKWLLNRWNIFSLLVIMLMRCGILCLLNFGVQVDISGTPFSLFQKAIAVKFSSQIFALWITANVTGFYVIWYTRNQSFHEGVLLPFSKAFVVITRAIKEENELNKGYMDNFATYLLLLNKLKVKVFIALGS